MKSTFPRNDVTRSNPKQTMTGTGKEVNTVAVQTAADRCCDCCQIVQEFLLKPPSHAATEDMKMAHSFGTHQP